MRGIAFLFVVTATVYLLAGMALGIHMSASGNHAFTPVHAHLNLIGWVTMALFGLYYHVVPEAAASRLAMLHFAVATAGVLLIVPGIALAITNQGETLAKLGSVVTIVNVLVFFAVVLRSRLQAA